MAKNDILLIDSIIDDRCDQLLPSNDKGEVFEFLACEQILKEYDLTKDEILQGIVDGKDDGGIDAMYIFIKYCHWIFRMMSLSWCEMHYLLCRGPRAYISLSWRKPALSKIWY